MAHHRDYKKAMSGTNEIQVIAFVAAMALFEGLAIVDGMLTGTNLPIALIAIAEKGYLTVEREPHGAGGTPPCPHSKPRLLPYRALYSDQYASISMPSWGAPADSLERTLLSFLTRR
jgi:hypothetical protein